MEILKNTLTVMDIPWNQNTMDQFNRYRDLVLEWNAKVNLTAIRDPLEFEIKHFADSVSCCPFSGFLESRRILDVGTGAGFPGMPLAILFPEKEFVLLDSLNKRIKILNEIIGVLGLTNVHAIHGRAEDISRQKEHREAYDICLSRAVADLAVLSEYCLPFVKIGGWFGAYKTKNAEEEIRNAQRAVTMLGGRLVSRTPYVSPGENFERQILWIQKERVSGSKYPRKAGTPEKEPLR